MNNQDPRVLRADYDSALTPSSVTVNNVLKNTYMLLGMTLTFSALMAWVAIAIQAPPMNIWLLIGVYFGLLFLVHKTAESAAGIAAVFALTGWLGFTTGPIISAYMAAGAGQTVGLALGGTAAIFFGLSAFALVTKKDFGFMAKFVVVGLIVAFVAAIANIFFAIPALSLAISSAFMVLSSAVILMQTSAIVNGGETNYIHATVTLFVSIYNIFLSLLNILTAFDD